jgi:F-box/leucine-rich repeat protein 17
VTDNTFIRVSQQCRCITELSLAGCDSVSEGSIQLMLSNCRLQRITLFECPQMSLATVFLIARRCNVSLLELHLSQIVVQLVDLAGLCVQCPSLEALSLRSAGILSAHCPSYPNLKALRALDVSGNGAISNGVLINLMHEVPRSGLTRLNIAKCSLLDGEFVDHLIARYKGLQELDMSQCGSLSDKVAVTAVKHLSALKTLNLSGNFKLNKQTMNAICEHAHSLESLDVSHCPNVQLFGVLKVLDACPLLRRVDVTGCKNVEGLKVKHHVANMGMRCVVIAGGEFIR